MLRNTEMTVQRIYIKNAEIDILHFQLLIILHVFLHLIFLVFYRGFMLFLFQDSLCKYYFELVVADNLLSQKTFKLFIVYFVET